MITKEQVAVKLGKALDAFGARINAEPEYEVEEDECLSLTFAWTTQFGLSATLMLGLEEEGVSVNTFLNRQPVQLGRTGSWDMPASKVLRRLTLAHERLENITAPPLGFIGGFTQPTSAPGWDRLGVPLYKPEGAGENAGRA